MKRLYLLVLFAFAASLPATAEGQARVRVGSGDSEVDGRLVPRMRPADARHAIVSRSGDVALLLTDDALLVQLTDAGRDRMGDEIDREIDPENGFARFVGLAVRGGLSLVFRRAMEFDLDDLGDVRYRDGALVVTDRAGERILEDFEIDDRRILSDFSDRDGRAFAARFRRLRDRRGA